MSTHPRRVAVLPVAPEDGLRQLKAGLSATFAKDQMTDHRYGAYIKLDDVPVGLFLDGAYPDTPGEYGYMPMRSIGHYNMATAIRTGQAPRCTWTRGGRSVSFDVLSIPRYGILSIDNFIVSDIAASDAPEPVVSDAAPPPPWVVNPDDYEAPWLQGNSHYINSTWRPFWRTLDQEARAAYLNRFPLSCSWHEFLADVDFDDEVARIDEEDIASGVLQPNGLPWPQPKVVRLALWRRLLGRH